MQEMSTRTVSYIGEHIRKMTNEKDFEVPVSLNKNINHYISSLNIDDSQSSSWTGIYGANSIM